MEVTLDQGFRFVAMPRKVLIVPTTFRGEPQHLEAEAHAVARSRARVRVAHRLQLLRRNLLPPRGPPMKLRLLLIAAIFATTPVLADSQTQAAALLSRPQTPATMKLERSSSVSEVAIDAHASAAALLSGHHIAHHATMSSAIRDPLYGQMPPDAHSQAAALLSGMRTAAGS